MKIELPSGRVVNYTPVPRFVLWRHQRIGQTFQIKVKQIEEGFSDASQEEQGMRLFESMTEDEAQRFQAFADDVVKHATGQDPSSFTEFDYMTIVTKVLYSQPGVKVQVKEGETTVEAVETFPVKPQLHTNGEDVPDLSDSTESTDGDSGSDHGRRHRRSRKRAA